jgi:NAD(P)-dependent dehydrogenase (short-subunit alcohol dehydrogenase family)
MVPVGADLGVPQRIIFTASRNSLSAEPNYAHYVAAKHGLLGYMKALAIELGPFEINVNAVCPTPPTRSSTVNASTPADRS